MPSQDKLQDELRVHAQLMQRCWVVRGHVGSGNLLRCCTCAWDVIGGLLSVLALTNDVLYCYACCSEWIPVGMSLHTVAGVQCCLAAHCAVPCHVTVSCPPVTDAVMGSLCNVWPVS